MFFFLVEILNQRLHKDNKNIGKVHPERVTIFWLFYFRNKDSQWDWLFLWSWKQGKQTGVIFQHCSIWERQWRWKSSEQTATGRVLLNVQAKALEVRGSGLYHIERTTQKPHIWCPINLFCCIKEFKSCTEECRQFSVPEIFFKFVLALPLIY